MKKLKPEIVNSLIGAIIGGLIIVALDDARFIQDDARKDQQEYCEMVELFNDSKGELGWPDYKKSYEEDCRAAD